MAILDSVAYRDGPAPSLDALLGVDAGQVAFVKDKSGLTLGAGFLENGVLSLGSDGLFFEAPSALDDIKAVVSRLTFPPHTIVVGDTEFRLMDVQESGLPLVSPQRLQSMGFLWVDMLRPQQWRRVQEDLSRDASAVLGVAGDDQIVRLWENPFERKGLCPDFRRLAQRIAVHQ